MKPQIQQRIRDRREAFGASIAEMSELAEMTTTRWSEIEAGGGFSVSELGRISQALAVDAGGLLRGEETDPRRTVARFRKADPLEEVSFRELRSLSLAAELGRIGGALFRMLGRPIPLLKFRKQEPPGQREPWQQGYRLGELARKTLPIARGPIVNLQQELETLGVHVATLAFADPSVDAASLYEPGAMPILLLNRQSRRGGHQDQVLPRRAAMAHELCHLLHDAGEDDVETRMSRQDEGQGEDWVEQRARGFAPAFLAPRDEVRQFFNLRQIAAPRDKVLVLAKHWGFSWKGACWHAQNCRQIAPKTCDLLVDEGPPSGTPTWHSKFEMKRALDKPALVRFDQIHPLCQGLVSRLVADAVDEGAISEGRAREILRWG